MVSPFYTVSCASPPPKKTNPPPVEETGEGFWGGQRVGRNREDVDATSRPSRSHAGARDVNGFQCAWRTRSWYRSDTMATDSPTPSHADFSTPPSGDGPPIERAWVEAAARERFWYAAHMAALAFLLLAVLTWQRTAPNVAIETALCLFVGVAASRHSQSGRRRARLSPLRSEPCPEPPAKLASPLVKAPRA